MGVVNNDNNIFFNFFKNVNNIQQPQIVNNDVMQFDFSKFFSNCTNSNMNSNCYLEAPEGLTQFSFNGASLDIFRNKDKYKTQFVYPQNFNMNEFMDKCVNFKSNRPDPVQLSPESAKGTINGTIDETVVQGRTGDCWLISSLLSLSKNDQGRKVISDAITQNSDGSVTIDFKGVGVSYTLTKDEIAQFDTDKVLNDSYSNGDNDVLVFELAAEKLRQDIQNGKVQVDNKAMAYVGNGGGITDGGDPAQMIYYLTGTQSNQIMNQSGSLTRDQLNSALQDALNTNSVVNIGLLDGYHSCKCTDGSTYSIDLSEGGGHALAVTNITQDTVTFVNPWDSSKEYTVTWDEFANLGVDYMCSSDLTQKDEKQTVDLTNGSKQLENNTSVSSGGSCGSGGKSKKADSPKVDDPFDTDKIDEEEDEEDEEKISKSEAMRILFQLLGEFRANNEGVEIDKADMINSLLQLFNSPDIDSDDIDNSYIDFKDFEDYKEHKSDIDDKTFANTDDVIDLLSQFFGPIEKA